MKDIDLYIQKKQGPREPILWIHGYTLDSNSWQEMWELLPEYTHIGIDLLWMVCQQTYKKATIERTQPSHIQNL